MSLSKRVFVGFFLLLALVAYGLLNTVFDELKPAFNRATEETLVDTANVLAELLTDDMARSGSPSSEFAAALQRYSERRFDARIYELRKTEPGLRIYVTDANGVVLFDTAGQAEGADYSRWNDVYLTLRGEYGARATREDPNDEYSAVYYVAAPIRHAGELLGVVSVGKPSRTLLPYLEASEAKIRFIAILLFAGGILLAAVFAAWLNASIRKLTTYANAVSRGDPAQLPDLGERELASLGAAMARMRGELEGKEYIEDTVHALTHELKSPLAAIRGAVELLREEPQPDDRERFLENIESESFRLQRITERMLQLASVEKRGQLSEARQFDLIPLVRDALAARDLGIDARDLRVDLQLPPAVMVEGDPFLLEQAIGNLLDNAIDFSPRGGALEISLKTDAGQATLIVADSGPGIPAYARERIFERFYSLPRPDGGSRSTGLGLSFVREVARLHRGDIRLADRPGGGTAAELRLPHE